MISKTNYFFEFKIEDINIAFKTVKWFPFYQEFLKCMIVNLSSKIPILRANIMVTLSHYSYFVINKSHKKYLLPLIRMVSQLIYYFIKISTVP